MSKLDTENLWTCPPHLAALPWWVQKWFFTNIQQCRRLNS